MTRPRAWSMAEEVSLKYLWRKGTPPEVIAERIGRPVGGIQAKAYLLGLAIKGDPHGNSARSVEEARKRSEAARKAAQRGPAAIPTQEAPQPPDPIHASPQPKWNGTCQWIEGPAAADAPKCGNIVARPGSAWCPEHYRRVYQPLAVRLGGPVDAAGINPQPDSDGAQVQS